MQYPNNILQYFKEMFKADVSVEIDYDIENKIQQMRTFIFIFLVVLIFLFILLCDHESVLAGPPQYV